MKFLCAFAVLVASFVLSGSALAVDVCGIGAQSARADDLRRVPLPPGVAREQVADADPGLRALLSRHVEHWMRAHTQGLLGGIDVIVLVDGAGQPILPDIEAAVSGSGRIVTTGNELSFTFESPDDPWTRRQVIQLKRLLRRCQRRVIAFYGPPFFANTVNVRRAVLGAGIAGTYNLSINEIALADVRPDAVCHEMIHAFRDDATIYLQSYEEGMTRAAEVELFNRMGRKHPFDEHHSYVHDVFFEAMNTPVIGSPGGFFFSGYINPFLRYNLAGYAWWKVLVENPSFFLDFNQALYDAVAIDPSVLGSEPTLKALAAATQPEVEAMPFADWYDSQGVLGTSPPLGYLVYPRTSAYFDGLRIMVIDFFERRADGQELMQSGATLDWAVYDHADALLSSGSDVTSSGGSIIVNLAVPAGYRGRAKIVAMGSAPGGSAAATTFAYWGVPGGVFGIVTNADTGSVTITPLDRGPPHTVPVANGAFAVPVLRHRWGRFDVVFTGPGGETIARRFNKDKSDYFLQLGLSP